MKNRKKRRITALVLCAAVMTAGFAQIPAATSLPVHAASVYAELYVSPDGDDSNAGTKAAPLQTLAGARNAVRKIKDGMTGDIVVYFREGVYRMTEAVAFDTQDSAPEGCRIIYQAYEGETPVFSGAKQVTGWEKYNEHLYAAPLNRDTKLRNLYVNDHRANMGSVRVEAQGGWGEYGITAGQADWAWVSGLKSDGVKYRAGDVPKIESNFDDLEIVNGTTWNENIVCTRDVKYDGGTLILLLQQPYGAIAQTPGWNCAFNCGGQHTIYNAFSFLDEPGEFYFDKTAKMLYYYPYDWEDMATADAEVPFADQLITISGKSTSDRVQNLTFSGITFAHTDYQLTEVDGSHGKTTCQAAQTYTAFADSNWHQYKYEMVDTLPGVINVTNADSVHFTGNVIKHTGADGLSMPNDVVNCTVSGNYITDITSSGITIGHPQHVYIGDGDGSNKEKYPRGVEGICKNDTVSDNLLYDISVVHGFGGCAAVTAYFVDSVKILRNQVQKTAYNGIHLGWGWNMFLDSETCRDNQICYNRVIDAVNRLHDSGAIYTIGQMPGTVINENYVDGIPAGGFGAPTYGLHNDDGTAWIEEFDNVLDISKDVTYTINCEDFGIKHHLNIKRTYATVNKMGKNPPDCDIDPPIVVADAVWPQKQYEICVSSGLQDEFKRIMPENMMTDADYVFPASCATTGDTVIPIRKAGSGKTVWFAPAGTTAFKAGGNMTKVTGTAAKIKTPAESGEYYIYVTDASGRVLSRSKHLLRVGSGSAAMSGDAVEAAAYDMQSGVDIENLQEGGRDVGYIENGDWIGFKNVDFRDGADAIEFCYASPSGGSSIEVRLDAPDGKLIGTGEVKNTGGWHDFATNTAALEKATGNHDLYFVFKGGEGYLFNLMSWKLKFPNEPAQTDDWIYGDINGDEVIDALDLTLLKRAVLSGTVAGLNAGDLNGDLDIDAEDVRLHIDYLTGKIERFPVEE